MTNVVRIWKEMLIICRYYVGGMWKKLKNTAKDTSLDSRKYYDLDFSVLATVIEGIMQK
jgi:hypothetical protein